VKAERLFYSREELGDGTVVELRLWRVPQPVPPSQHRFKYALFYGQPGTRLVLFDNERGKGDHKHIRETESPYVFSTPEALVADFLEAVRTIQQEDQSDE
jgi:hypothetical protein